MFAYAWPWSIVLFIPLALLVFPDGLLPGRFWRAVVWFTVRDRPGVRSRFGRRPDPGRRGAHDRPVARARGLPAARAAVDRSRRSRSWRCWSLRVVGLVVRYRRGDEQRRRQLLWLVLALLLMIVVVVPWGLFAAGPILELLSIALVPAAMTIAVLRYQLLDIRLVLSRTVVYVLLTVAVVGGVPRAGRAGGRWCCAGRSGSAPACWPPW